MVKPYFHRGGPVSEANDASIGQFFQHALETESRKKGITYEYVERSSEQLRVEHRDGVPYVIGNSEGLLALAKLLIKVSAGKHCGGFHLHLREDFDSDRAEVLRIMLQETALSQPPSPGEPITGEKMAEPQADTAAA